MMIKRSFVFEADLGRLLGIPTQQRQATKYLRSRGLLRDTKSIARQLGVTESGLTVLFRIKRGDQISGGQAGARLARQGLVNPAVHLGEGRWTRGELTPAGLQVCEKARKLGY